jgi:hypothetical protein
VGGGGVVGPWTKKLLEVLGGEESDLQVDDLRIERGLITARVGEERVTLSAPPIPQGVWAALDTIRTNVQSESLALTLQHTWEEPLVPATIVQVGSSPAVAAVVAAAAKAVEDDPAALLRWRGYGGPPKIGDEWRGDGIPELPPVARRPPESVPQRFGASGVRVGDGDLVEVLVRAYRSF